MNEIKFRSAHYNYKGEFIAFSYWGFVNHKGEYDINCFCAPSSRTGTERKQEEQYTGLKDKNRKEIYKGDIVKPLYVGDRYKDDIFEIVFQRSAFSMDLIGRVHDFKPATSFAYYDLSGYRETGKPMINDGIVEVEIIGNIHQNADLL